MAVAKQRIKAITMISLINRIPLIMAALVAVAIITVVGTLTVAMIHINTVAQQNAVVLVGNGLKAMQNKLDDFNRGFSVWDKAYEAVSDRDIDWIATNISSGASNGSFDLHEILWPTPGDTLGRKLETGDRWQPGILSPDIERYVRQAIAATPEGTLQPVSFVFRNSAGVHLLSAKRIIPHTDLMGLRDQDYAISVMTTLLSTEISRSFGSMSLLEDLEIAPFRKSGTSAIPLEDHMGQTIAYLQWKTPQPGITMIREIGGVLGSSLVLFLALSTLAAALANQSALILVRREKEAAHAARTDFITGLPNRLAFNAELKKLFSSKGPRPAVLFMDVNDFKRVNDSFGHAEGDKLVRHLADRISDSLPTGMFVARVGGDEFNIILPGPNPDDDVARFVTDLQVALDAGFFIQGRPHPVSLAMGYAIPDSDDIRPEELVRRADMAMYEAKAAGSTRPIKYTHGIEPTRRSEIQIEAAIREALVTETEFSVIYQPIFCARKRTVKIAEALVRWNSATLGIVPPDRFVAVAEKSGLMGPVSLLVIKQVCKDLQKTSQLRASINISPLQIVDPSFLAKMKYILAAYGIAPNRLEIELTEGVVVENWKTLAGALQKLHAQGHSIALDDFGTGFSSLGYLRRMKFDTLKIDRSMVLEALVDKASLGILEATVKLAQSLDLKLVAEGVENQEQAEFLTRMGFDMLQGYFVGDTMTFDGIMAKFAIPANAQPPTGETAAIAVQERA